jgi:hypothetical protein
MSRCTIPLACCSLKGIGHVDANVEKLLELDGTTLN